MNWRRDTDTDRVTGWSILAAVIVVAVIVAALWTLSLLPLLGGR
jgi:hypothetical protein